MPDSERRQWVIANIPKQGEFCVSRFPAPTEKPLHWVASSRRDLLAMPSTVVRAIGLALSVAQFGGRHPHAKQWKGLGSGVIEIVSEREGNAFRAV